MEGITRTVVKRKYQAADLDKRIKNILLCHFMVGTAHVSLAFVLPGQSGDSFKTVIFYLALVLSARRYIMFGNDFNYIHSKKFHRMSEVLRYENVPCLQYLLIILDVVILLYRILSYFIESRLQSRDLEMLMFYAYVLIPVLILFVIYTAMEEKRMSEVLRYENVPCLQYLLIILDVVILLYRILSYFIESRLQSRDLEMLMFYAYVLIPVLILFVIYTAIEEKVVYKEILNPSVEIYEEFIPDLRTNQNTEYTNFT